MCRRFMLRRQFRTMSNRPLYTAITEKLTKAFTPVQLIVSDDSHMHRGHAGVQNASSPETHFSVEIVSDAFTNMNRVQRQRMVNQLLKDEFDKGLHALALCCKTSGEA